MGTCVIEHKQSALMVSLKLNLESKAFDIQRNWVNFIAIFAYQVTQSCTTTICYNPGQCSTALDVDKCKLSYNMPVLMAFLPVLNPGLSRSWGLDWPKHFSGHLHNSFSHITENNIETIYNVTLEQYFIWINKNKIFDDDNCFSLVKDECVIFLSVCVRKHYYVSVGENY
jgi:hypothetical protein